MGGAFKEVGIRLIKEKGLSVIPIGWNSKSPAVFTKLGWKNISVWEQYNKRLPIEDEYLFWAEMEGSNIGILLGDLNGIIALDFDYFDDLTESIYSELPDSPIRKKGSKGFTAFYKYNNEKSAKWSKDGKTVVELLSTGRQTVIPPSTHPDGMSYQWLTKHDFLNFDVKDLPILPPNFVQIVENALGITNERPEQLSEKTILGKHRDDIEKSLEGALAFIPADDYDLWLKIGMALSSWDRNKGFHYWDKWSSKSVKYPGTEKLIPKFKSFSGNGFKIESVYYEAYKRGFTIPKAVEKTYKELHPSFYNSISKIKETPKAEAKTIKISEDKLVRKLKPLPMDIVLSAPNLCGEIVNYILESSIFPQPELALASTLIFLGTLKAQRVRTETDLRTNNYIVGIAPASSGKDHGLTCLQQIVTQCGLQKLYGGKPASDSGLLKMLESNPRKMVTWDEIGLAFREITDVRSQGYKKAILTLMMELFSSANKTYFGKEYANKDGKTPRVDLHKPCLSVYGVTTPTVFYESLNTGMISDGFISRFLVFEISNNFPEECNVRPDRFLLPKGMEAKIRQIDSMEYYASETDTKPEARTIYLSGDAKELLDKIKREYHEKKIKYFEIQDGLQSLWGRGVEHILKIALTVQEGNKIEYSDLFWSYEVVNHCISQLCDSLQTNLIDSDFGKKMNDVKEVFQKAEKSTMTEKELKKRLYYKVGRKRDQDEVIQALIAVGDLIVDGDSFTLVE